MTCFTWLAAAVSARLQCTTWTRRSSCTPSGTISTMPSCTKAALSDRESALGTAAQIEDLRRRLGVLPRPICEGAEHHAVRQRADMRLRRREAAIDEDQPIGLRQLRQRTGFGLGRGREARLDQRLEFGELPGFVAPGRKAAAGEALARPLPDRAQRIDRRRAERIEENLRDRGKSQGCSWLRPHRRAWRSRSFPARPPGSCRPT